MMKIDKNLPDFILFYDIFSKLIYYTYDALLILWRLVYFHTRVPLQPHEAVHALN